MDNPNIKLLSKELFNYLLKYDDCINKYENKQQMDNNEILNIFNEIFDRKIKPYKQLTHGKEIEELENHLSSDLNEIKKYMGIYNFLSDECNDLAINDLNNYYLKNKMVKSEDEILDILEGYKDSFFDSNIFSAETIDKSKLLEEFKPIYKKLCLAYSDIQEDEEEI